MSDSKNNKKHNYIPSVFGDADSLAKYKLKTVLKHLEMSSFDYDIKNDIIYVQKEYVLLEGFTNYWFKDGGDYYYLENVQEALLNIIRGSYQDAVFKHIEHIRNNKTGELVYFDTPIVYADDKTRWTNFILDTILDENGEPTHAIGYCKDIHLQKKELFRLRRVAQTDALTGFRNRTSGEFKIKEQLVEQKDSVFFLAFIDLDKFKDANDLFGHTFGDMLLKNVSERINEASVRDKICCRVGGDEFLYFRKCESVEDAKKILSGIQKAIRHTVTYQGSSFFVDASFGFSMYPQQGTTFEELYDKADAAMYYAKNNEVGTPVLYEDTMESIRTS